MDDFDMETLEQVDVLLEHLNHTHADTVVFVAQHLDPSVLDADLVAADARGAVFAVRREAGSGNVRLGFPGLAGGASDVRRHLLSAVAEARADAPASRPLTSLESELETTAALRTVHGTIRDVRRLTPSMFEVTVAGLHDWPPGRGDEFVYVMVSPEPGGISPSYTMADFRNQTAGDPVHGAYYTVRRSRPHVGEIDLWVVEHDHPGSVAEWMRDARPGTPIALWGPRRGFELPKTVDDALLIADESGLAAIAALIEVALPEQQIVAVLESADAAHRPPMPAHPNLRTVWVHRGTDAPGQVNHLLELVRVEVDKASVPPSAAFGAAESRQISAIRRYLRSEVGMPAAVVSMTGYWRRGSN